MSKANYISEVNDISKVNGRDTTNDMSQTNDANKTSGESIVNDDMNKISDTSQMNNANTAKIMPHTNDASKSKATNSKANNSKANNSKANNSKANNSKANNSKAASAEKNILIAFLLNFLFIIVEVIGGILTNSIAILSDAIHDFGDCTAIGFAYAMEKLSNKNADDFYTYGYKRFSLLSALVTSLILVVGGAVVVYSSIKRLFSPQEVSGLGMLIIAVVGVVVNGLAVLKTSHGHKLNEKVISLHMLEDVLGWAVVLVGSIFIWLFGLHIVDPILSIGISIFILIQALKNMRRAFQTLLERAPVHFDMAAYKGELLKIQNVSDVHHVHVWELDDENLLATLHVVVPDSLVTDDIKLIKQSLKEESAKYKIGHLTVQIDYASEENSNKSCVID